MVGQATTATTQLPPAKATDIGCAELDEENLHSKYVRQGLFFLKHIRIKHVSAPKQQGI